MKSKPPIRCGKENNKYRHGLSGTRLHRIYWKMIERCYSPSNRAYSSYGAKGVTVCDEWKNDNVPFFEWALSNGYEDSLSLDRIDNSQGYSPANCRWVTMTQQQNNRTNNKRITCNGETHTIAEWSRITGINRYCLYQRVKLGWSDEKIITTPSKAEIKSRKDEK